MRSADRFFCGHAIPASVRGYVNVAFEASTHPATMRRPITPSTDSDFKLTHYHKYGSFLSGLYRIFYMSGFVLRDETRV